MISVFLQFLDDMQTCVRLNDGKCSGWFCIEKCLRQGCVLAPLLLNMFLVAVIRVFYTRFEEVIGHHGRPGRPRGENARWEEQRS